MPGSDAPATSQRTDRRHALILAASGLGILLAGIDATGINVVLPTIQRDLGTSLATLQWTVTTFLLAVAVLVIAVGRLGDQHGRRRVYLIGLSVFAAGSAICGAAGADWTLIAGRAVQGAGAAALFTISMAIVRQSFPPARLGWAIGVYAAIAALGLALGPLVAGVLADAVSWRAFFFANIPVVALAMALTISSVGEYRDESAGRHVDVPGILTLGVGLGALLVALAQADAWGWGSAATLGLIAGAAVVLAAFVAVERRAGSPLIDLAMFRSRTFAGANASVAIVFAVVFSFLFLFGLYFQNVQDDSPFVAGLRLVPYPLAFLVVASSVGRLADRIGPRTLMTTGMLAFAASMLALSEVSATTSEWVLLPILVVVGIANALVMVPATPAALTAVAPEQAGVAAGVTVTSRYVGASLGLAVSVALFQALAGDEATAVGDGAEVARDAFVTGLSGAMKLTAALALAGAAVVLATIGGRHEHRLQPHLRLRRHGHSPHG